MGSVELRLPDESRLKVKPLRFTLQATGVAGDHQRVRVSHDNADIGLCRETIQVVTSGGRNKHGSVDVTAEVLRPRLTLLGGDKGILDNVDFGCIFYGESKKVMGVLVNNGPQPMSFSVTYADEDEHKGQGLGQGQGLMEDSVALLKSLLVSPSDGIVKPFSEVTVAMTFKPEYVQQKQGFERQFVQNVHEARLLTRKVVIECPEIDQRIMLILQGGASVPLITVSPAVMRFGSCPVHDRRDIKVRGESLLLKMAMIHVV